MTDITTNAQLKQILEDSKPRIESAGQRRYHNAYGLLNRVAQTLYRLEKADDSASPDEQNLAVAEILLSRLDMIERDLTWLEDASFTLGDDEYLVMADEAEWVKTGNEQRDPNGILYLTDKRLLFEQKEVTEKRFGLMGGGEQHELERSYDLTQLGRVDAIGDQLHVTLRSGNQRDAEVFTIFGDPATWDAQLGAYCALPPRVVMTFIPDGELPDGMEDIIREFADGWYVMDGEKKLNKILNDNLVDPIELAFALGHPDPVIRLGVMKAFTKAKFAFKEDVAYAIYWLLSAVQNEPDVQLRRTAMYAINYVFPNYNVGKGFPIPDDAINRVTPPELQTQTPFEVMQAVMYRVLAFDENAWVRAKAAELIDDKFFKPDPFLGLLYTSDDPDVQAFAAYHLFLRDTDAIRQQIDILIEPLTHAFLRGYRYRLFSMFDKIQEFGDKRLATCLYPFLQEGSSHDRNKVMEILSALDVDDLGTVLQGALKSDDASERKYASGLLLKSGDVDMLREHLKQETDEIVRGTILFGLFQQEQVKLDNFEDIMAVIKSMHPPASRNIEDIEMLVPKLAKYPERAKEITAVVRPFMFNRVTLDTLAEIGDWECINAIKSAVLNNKISMGLGESYLKKMGVKNPRVDIQGLMHPKQLESWRRSQNRNSPSRKFPDKF